MAKFADRVVETTQTTGTGTLDLDGAQTGFRAFSDELTTGETVFYVIEDDPASPTEYEYGIGTWTSGSPNTLSRDTIEGSSNGGSKISLAGGTTYTVSGTITKSALGGEGPLWSVLETAQATTSGTSKDYTSIPSWVKKITFNFSVFSTNGTSIPIIQIGDSGGLETTSYVGAAAVVADSVDPTTVAFSTGFAVNGTWSAANVMNGSITLTLLATDIWCASGVLGFSNAVALAITGGVKDLSGTLDRLRLTTVNGTDTFDAGNINIVYE